MSPEAEIGKNQEPQVITKAKAWTLSQPKGRVHTDRERISFHTEDMVKGTISRTEDPKILVCTRDFAGVLEKTGLIFHEPHIKK